ncbi:hypothetical protein HPB50_006872 [Hyalomma asiaticum]|uniref:Uncharacterized protein n=1 Tax=Hyalomma asiaticum TaxID=266040 RepID=A0ACB7T3B5_HYAAI|nr:hypothetical protein HPB50_006872 [Hyalomma asiaticum]
MPRLPEGFSSVACEVDPAAALILRRPPYDVCPLMAELLRALSRESWFARVVGSRRGTPEALDSVVSAFYRLLSRYLDRYRRPVRPGRAGNSWWSPELAEERRRVNAMRRRFQRARDESMRTVWRQEYCAALARLRRHIRQARDSYERECHSACSRSNVFFKTFREAFGRTRPPRLLPPLERPDTGGEQLHERSCSCSDRPLHWAHRNRLKLQSRPAIGDPLAAAPEPFRGNLITERYPSEPLDTYTPEEARLLCPTCEVPEIHRRQHQNGALHQIRLAAASSPCRPNLPAAASPTTL